ncbi:excitatory amino acid transporter 5-like [Petromyzon marinus]|uniref:Amino acid transporter n=1 Tax=Petromyzon marinus TaxID=7757 RepID=A0AAJ7T262_PETMA|nr:excitatory amino acid transporter 5-like [Petromyzon marinus]XP_032809489.1 excitatory amino acid transporter 5-like [Petromyzon marinus]
MVCAATSSTAWLRVKASVLQNLLLILSVMSVIVGCLLGFLLRAKQLSQQEIQYLAFPGELLMRMLKMLILPLVTSSLISGLAALDSKTCARLGLVTVSYYLSTTLLAVLIGIVLACAVHPGSAAQRDGRDQGGRSLPSSADALLDLIRNMFPANLVEATFQQYRTNMVSVVKPRNETPHLVSPVTSTGTTLPPNITSGGGAGRGGGRSKWPPTKRPAPSQHQQHQQQRKDSQQQHPARHGAGDEVETTIEGRPHFVFHVVADDDDDGDGDGDDGGSGRGGGVATERVLVEMVTLPPRVSYRSVPGTSGGMNVLGIVIFSATMGVMLGKMGHNGLPLVTFCQCLNEAVLRIVSVTVWYFPLGIVFLVAAKVLEMDDPSQLGRRLGLYSATVVAGLVLHGLIVLPCIYCAVTRRNPVAFMRGMLQALLIALATSSSSATLPITFRCLLENNHIDRRIARFVLPVGATINMDGTALYEAVAAIFIAQVNGYDLDLGQLITISITATAASIGAAGIPQSGLVTMAIVLTSVGLPSEDISLIVAVDWALDRFRTMVNVLGDSLGAGIISHICRKEFQQLDGGQRIVELKSMRLPHVAMQRNGAVTPGVKLPRRAATYPRHGRRSGGDGGSGDGDSGGGVCTGTWLPASPRDPRSRSCRAATLRREYWRSRCGMGTHSTSTAGISRAAGAAGVAGGGRGGGEAADECEERTTRGGERADACVVIDMNGDDGDDAVVVVIDSSEDTDSESIL